MVARFHYDQDVLERFLRDRLRGDEAAVATHIEQCETCQINLEAVSRTELSWDELPKLLGSGLDDATTAKGHSDDPDDSVALTFLQPSDRPGTLGRFGRYEILETLGRGGMGIVMRGIDSALDRHCAIKVLAPEFVGSGAARKRFSREARSAAAVVHPHVVPIQTVDEQDGVPYLVMPVVEGRSLQQRVEQDGPLQVIEAVRIAAQVADGLSAAHSQGLVHRDIKPANVLLENDVERVQITDFGLARAVDDASMTRSGVIAGTPQYMSPEQAHGDTIDHRSDLFSLGSVIYFMLTGRSPFRAETSMGVLNRICHDQPRSLRSVNSEVPPWLDRIVTRLLEKSPDERFQSSEELAELLRESLMAMNHPHAAHKEHHERRPAIAPPSASTKPPRRFLVRFLAAAFAFLALGATVFYLQTNNGTLRIESNSDIDVPIRIVNGEDTVDQITVSKDGATTRLRAGTYVIEVDDVDSHLQIRNNRFTLRRGDTWTVTITPVSRHRGTGQQFSLQPGGNFPRKFMPGAFGRTPPSADESASSSNPPGKSMEEAREAFVTAFPETLSDRVRKAKDQSILQSFVDVSPARELAVTVKNRADDSAYQVLIWNSRTGKLLKEAEQAGTAAEVRFSQNSEFIGVQKFLDTHVDVFDARAGRLLDRLASNHPVRPWQEVLDRYGIKPDADPPADASAPATDADQVLKTGRPFPTIQQLARRAPFDSFETADGSAPWPRFRFSIHPDGTYGFQARPIQLDELASKLPIEKLMDDGGRIGIEAHVDVPLEQVKAVVEAFKATPELNAVQLQLFEYEYGPEPHLPGVSASVDATEFGEKPSTASPSDRFDSAMDLARFLTVSVRQRDTGAILGTFDEQLTQWSLTQGLNEYIEQLLTRDERPRPLGSGFAEPGPDLLQDPLLRRIAGPDFDWGWFERFVLRRREQALANEQDDAGSADVFADLIATAIPNDQSKASVAAAVVQALVKDDGAYYQSPHLLFVDGDRATAVCQSGGFAWILQRSPENGWQINNFWSTDSPRGIEEFVKDWPEGLPRKQFDQGVFVKAPADSRANPLTPANDG
ncbi:serine/threonine protein kinase [Roseiconus nitratireducens]|uniref:non-specific serine/threonine protein kinase n=1 Tax=Roseiconus nitratireducens TaxID=2605748 RepID=A0A5M6CYZ1_9BACT|nr:serine/threonine-protein kinase [Roseiconus nitratireducens]KAA5538519.1 serine/threonine protein kinase [Roseiconus nitratireducens]